MDVAGNVAFGLEMRKRPKAEVRERVERALEMVHLQGLGHAIVDDPAYGGRGDFLRDERGAVPRGQVCPGASESMRVSAQGTDDEQASAL